VVHDFVANSITAFMGFFAIMNPLANAPIFVGLTGALTDQARKSQ
jgi:multiple antibiotic resistance protein